MQSLQIWECERLDLAEPLILPKYNMAAYVANGNPKCERFPLADVKILTQTIARSSIRKYNIHMLMIGRPQQVPAQKISEP